MSKLYVLASLVAALTVVDREPVAATQQAKADVDALVRSGRAALAASRFDDADAAASQAFSQAPANRDAADLKIAVTLKKQRVDLALKVYDGHVQAIRHVDPALLEPIAKATLRELSARASDDEMLAIAALERLAGAKEADALQKLKVGPAATPQAGSPVMLARLASLARLGDESASRALGVALRSAGSDERREIARLIKEAGARRLAPALIPFLSDSEPGVRAAAAAALGALGQREALSALRPLLADPAPIVRPFAAASLKRLGDASADADVSAMLKSAVPQMRLIAAEAYQDSKSAQWVEWVKPLLDERNEMVRLRAAELLAAGDRETARLALLKALEDVNPLVRKEASRIIEQKRLGDAAVARRLLADDSAWVRVHAAGLVLALSGATKSPEKPLRSVRDVARRVATFPAISR